MMNNTHIHLLRDKDTSSSVVPFGMKGVLDTKVGFFLLSKLLCNINPFSNKDKFDRYVRIAVNSKLTAQQMFDKIRVEYPFATNLWALAVDQSCIGAGRVDRPYLEQLYELMELKEKNPTTLKIFIHLDPRNTDVTNIYNTSPAFRKCFDGIKLYTPMGYTPYDKRLKFALANAAFHNIPIITHCTLDSTIHFTGSKKELKELLKGVKPEMIDPAWKTKKELCNAFMTPDGYDVIFEKYPYIKISFAHYGRGNEWDKKLIEKIHRYKGCYVDVSYTMANVSRWADFKIRLEEDEIFRERCLFGSDWYMNIVECDEKQFSKELRVYLGEQFWKQITEINPINFLNKKS